jgi:small subunit ribosomal protein S16
MAVTIRLFRQGKKNQPFYRIVVTEKRKKRQGKYVEAIGFYNPLKNPAEVKIDQEKLKFWQERGAVLSEGLRKLL